MFTKARSSMRTLFCSCLLLIFSFAVGVLGERDCFGQYPVVNSCAPQAIYQTRWFQVPTTVYQPIYYYNALSGQRMMGWRAVTIQTWQAATVAVANTAQNASPSILDAPRTNLPYSYQPYSHTYQSVVCRPYRVKTTNGYTLSLCIDDNNKIQSANLVAP